MLPSKTRRCVRAPIDPPPEPSAALAPAALYEKRHGSLVRALLHRRALPTRHPQWRRGLSGPFSRHGPIGANLLRFNPTPRRKIRSPSSNVQFAGKWSRYRPFALCGHAYPLGLEGIISNVSGFGVEEAALQPHKFPILRFPKGNGSNVAEVRLTGVITGDRLRGGGQEKAEFRATFGAAAHGLRVETALGARRP